MNKNVKHMNSLNDFTPANDGKDHINIFSRGKTKLGRILSNFAHTPFTYEGVTFQSVEGALFYYRTDDTRFINLHGKEAKKLGKELEATRKETPELLREWYNAKIQANPEIIEMLIENNLPFAHYYVIYGKKIDKELISPEIWREITDELKKEIPNEQD